MSMPIPQTVAAEANAWDDHPRPVSPAGSTTSTLTGSLNQQQQQQQLPKYQREQYNHPAPHIQRQIEILLYTALTLGFLTNLSSFITYTFFSAFTTPSMFLLTITFAAVVLIYMRKEARANPEIRHANGFRMPTSAQTATIACAWCLAIGWAVVVGIIFVVYYLLLGADERQHFHRAQYERVVPFLEASFAILEIGVMACTAVLCSKEKRAVLNFRASQITW